MTVWSSCYEHTKSFLKIFLCLLWMDTWIHMCTLYQDLPISCTLVHCSWNTHKTADKIIRNISAFYWLIHVLFTLGCLLGSPWMQRSRILCRCWKFKVRCQALLWTGSTNSSTGPIQRAVLLTLACWTVRLGVRLSQDWTNLLQWLWILSEGRHGLFILN